MYMQENPKEQNMGGGYTILNHQGQMHPQEYGYTACVNASGKVQVGLSDMVLQSRYGGCFFVEKFVLSVSYLFFINTYLCSY